MAVVKSTCCSEHPCGSQLTVVFNASPRGSSDDLCKHQVHTWCTAWYKHRRACRHCPIQALSDPKGFCVRGNRTNFSYSFHRPPSVLLRASWLMSLQLSPYCAQCKIGSQCSPRTLEIVTLCLTLRLCLPLLPHLPRAVPVLKLPLTTSSFPPPNCLP